MTGVLSFRHAKPNLVRTLISERTDPYLFQLSRDYVGTDYGDHRPENTRVNVYITPRRIVTSG